VHGEDVSAAVCIGERDRDRHLAAQRGIRNEPPSRGSNAGTWLVMPAGTIHVATARASSSAR